MTMRYVAIPPRAFVSATHTPEHRPSCEVWDSDPTPSATGLLNADGTPLYRVVDKAPLGFRAARRCSDGREGDEQLREWLHAGMSDRPRAARL